MLTFFRRIRKELLDGGKTRRYLVYAIGEILLVMIGILLALQVNNWNEDTKDRKEEVQLLNGLADEFEENMDRIKRSMDANERSNSAANMLIEIIRSGELMRIPDELDSLIVTLTLWSSFDASTGVVDEIINSGKLTIIADRKLRTQLTRWPSLLEEVMEDRLIRVNRTKFRISAFTRYKVSALPVPTWKYELTILGSSCLIIFAG